MTCLPPLGWGHEAFVMVALESYRLIVPERVVTGRKTGL